MTNCRRTEVLRLLRRKTMTKNSNSFNDIDDLEYTIESILGMGKQDKTFNPELSGSKHVVETSVDSQTSNPLIWPEFVVTGLISVPLLIILAAITQNPLLTLICIGVLVGVPTICIAGYMIYIFFSELLRNLSRKRVLIPCLFVVLALIIGLCTMWVSRSEKCQLQHIRDRYSDIVEENQ